MLLLSESDVALLLDMELALEAVDSGLRALSGGQAAQPLRSIMRVEPHGNFLGLMPAHLKGVRAKASRDEEVLGLKAVTVARGNTALNLPTHLASILLVDPRTGEPLALMDGRLITEVRTAAASGVATRALARSDASHLAMLGTGVQAHSHLDALSRVRAIKTARVWSPHAESREGFAARESEHYSFPITACASAREAVEGADLIVTATPSHEPVLEGAWISPGAHINAVGAYGKTTRELDGEAVARSRVWVDSMESCWTEAGDIILAREEGRIGTEHVEGEVGALLLGRIHGRKSADEITLFKSLGVAVEDLATAAAVLERARERSVGTPFHLNA